MTTPYAGNPANYPADIATTAGSDPRNESSVLPSQQQLADRTASLLAYLQRLKTDILALTPLSINVALNNGTETVFGTTALTFANPVAIGDKLLVEAQYDVESGDGTNGGFIPQIQVSDGGSFNVTYGGGREFTMAPNGDIKTVSSLWVYTFAAANSTPAVRLAAFTSWTGGSVAPRIVSGYCFMAARLLRAAL